MMNPEEVQTHRADMRHHQMAAKNLQSVSVWSLDCYIGFFLPARANRLYAASFFIWRGRDWLAGSMTGQAVDNKEVIDNPRTWEALAELVSYAKS